jgi:cytosine/adenosine deaminase-related metal-dependent hydrolase
MRKITADFVCPVASSPLKDGVVIMDAQGRIMAIEGRDQHDPTTLERYEGVLVPGFINAHCHLELSHMKAKVDTGTGLLPFIHKVVSFRDEPEDVVNEAIELADAEMQRNGIVAVGDICNKTDTRPVKTRSPIRYYSFVEMFDFLQEAAADQHFDHYIKVYEQQADGNGNCKSVVPHAPYSVSRRLFERINAANDSDKQLTVSIHNQETPHEDALFKDGTGGFPSFYQGFGIKMEEFRPSGKTSIHYALANMDARQRTIFVHNTLTSEEDIRAAQAWSPHTYWATCPNANLYIENRLPDYRRFMATGAKVAIGTDSLTSNWQLCILEEMKTIARYQSYLDFHTLLRWATLNGAEALGLADQLGSLAVGKTPGLNLLTGIRPPDFALGPDVRVHRLA